MFFSIKKLSPTKKFGVIDIGTYKVKVAIIEVIGKEINVLGYAEKRQDELDITQSEISNIEGICNTIENALKKASKEAGTEVEKLIINLATSNVISEINTISYNRTTKNIPVTLKELEKIIGKVEAHSIDKAKSSILKNTGYGDADIKLITSSITKMSIDGQSVTNPIGFTGEEAIFRIMNVFTPLSKYNMMKTIGKFLNKEVEYIIPNEIAIPKIVEKTSYANNDVLFLDFGNTRTRVICQKSGSIEGFEIIEIGLNDLLKKIKEKSGKTKVHAITQLNKGKHKEEITEFMNIWVSGIHFAIEEITGSNEIPSKIFLTGGGNNEFVKEFIKNNFKNEFKISGDINFITDEIEIQIPEILEKSEIKINPQVKKKLRKSITSLLIATKDIINLKDDVIIDIIKEVLKKIKL